LGINWRGVVVDVVKLVAIISLLLLSGCRDINSVVKNGEEFKKICEKLNLDMTIGISIGVISSDIIFLCIPKAESVED
jgi:hypothetical protein